MGAFSVVERALDNFDRVLRSASDQYLESNYVPGTISIHATYVEVNTKQPAFEKPRASGCPGSSSCEGAMTSQTTC